MATTVDAAFRQLLDQQDLSRQMRSTAASRQNGLTTFFKNNFEMHQPLIAVGSYARNTMCAGERDIDFLAILNAYGRDKYWERYKDDSRKFLYWVRDNLNDRYAATKVSSRQICVKLDFTQIVTDVTPGFAREGGGFIIPNGRGGWMSTNPLFHTDFMAMADKDHKFALKPIVRLMKWWNISNGHHLQSLHVELLTEQIYRGYSIGANSFTVSEVLRCAPQWVRKSFADPWSAGGVIDSALTQADRDKVVRMLESDAKAAKEAEELRASGKHREAFERWSVVFRHNFPSYR